MEGEEYWPLGRFEPGRAAGGPNTISVSRLKNYATKQTYEQVQILCA